MNASGCNDFFELPLVGILRGGSSADLPHILDSVRQGGMRYLEITMNTAAAEEQITQAINLAEGAVAIGAGTVTTCRLLDSAVKAGAQFIVTPGFFSDVVKSCEERRIPIFSGAFTPTEIFNAWLSAPTQVRAVKIFPADALAPNYVSSLKAALPEVRLMPTGGVDLTTLPALVEAGADAFGIGSPLFQRDRIQAKDWFWLQTQVRAFVDAYLSAVHQRNAEP